MVLLLGRWDSRDPGTRTREVQTVSATYASASARRFVAGRRAPGAQSTKRVTEQEDPGSHCVQRVTSAAPVARQLDGMWKKVHAR